MAEAVGQLKLRPILPPDVITKVRQMHSKSGLGFIADDRDERICALCGYLKELHDDDA